MSQLFTSGGQSIGVSASASVLPMNIQDWFPLGWTSWVSLQSKGLSRIFSNTTMFSSSSVSLDNWDQPPQSMGFPGGSDSRVHLRCRRPRFNPWSWEDPLEKRWLPTSVLPGEFHGQRSLAGYSPWSCKESDIVEWLTFHCSQYNNTVVFPLVQGHKNPKYSRGNLNFQFSGNIVGGRIPPLGPKKQSPKLQVQEAKILFSGLLNVTLPRAILTLLIPGSFVSVTTYLQRASLMPKLWFKNIHI